MSMIAVFTTVGSLEQAQTIAGGLVERKLSACVQISRIESVYDWQGEIRNETEFRLFAKTLKERYPDVEAAILDAHPYDLPAIYAMDIEYAYGPYLEWVSLNSSGEVAGRHSD